MTVSRCVWCARSLARKRRDARTCSKECRQALSRFGGLELAAQRPAARTTFPPDAARVANAGATASDLVRECEWCCGTLEGRRSHTRTCSKACRQALARAAPDASLLARTRRARGPHLRPIAALYVHRGGAYYGLPNVDPWDVARDARRYAGPHPVIAHPPCSRWCRLAGLVQARWGHRKGEDGGCFESALRAVREWGGVLEHPAYSLAWPAFGLSAPSRFGGWEPSGGGWVCHVEQGRYGHAAKKATWLFAWGVPPDALPDLRWGYQPDREAAALVSWCANHTDDDRPRLSKAAASRTPATFRASLISLARAVDPDTLSQVRGDASSPAAGDGYASPSGAQRGAAAPDDATGRQVDATPTRPGSPFTAGVSVAGRCAKVSRSGRPGSPFTAGVSVAVRCAKVSRSGGAR